MIPIWVRLSLAVLTTVLMAVALYAYSLAKQAPTDAPEGASPQAVADAPHIGGPFTLRDDKGAVVTEKTLENGKYHLIFFGFSHCPDICPGMLQMMASVEEKLPAAVKDKLQFVFVSVDPDRDTLEKLGEYVRGFSPRFVGWTGEKAQIDEMVKNYLAYYAIKPAADPAHPQDYMVDHSGFAYLMGPDGRYVAHYRSSDSMTHLLEALMQAVK
jgi:protein SCO1/2